MEREARAERCLLCWGLLGACAGGSVSENLDLGREMEKGRAKGREGQMAELLLRDRAGSCAEGGRCEDHVDSWQWAAAGHLGGD